MGTLHQLPERQVTGEKAGPGGQVIPFPSGPLLSAPVREAVKILELVPDGFELIETVFKIQCTFVPALGAYGSDLVLTDFGKWAVDNPAAFIAMHQNGRRVH